MATYYPLNETISFLLETNSNWQTIDEHKPVGRSFHVVFRIFANGKIGHISRNRNLFKHDLFAFMRDSKKHIV